jgi:transposase
VELYARVRRAVVVDKMSEREAAKEFGLARETVRKMLRYSVPPGYRRQQPARRPKLDAWVGAIDQILEDDKAEGRKQRHTAKRIFERLHDEHGYMGGYTIREGLRAAQEAESARDVCAAGTSAGRCAGRLRRSDGGDRRCGMQGALSGDGPAAVR